MTGYVLAARAIDKCRAVLVGWQGEYHSNCPLDQIWLKFAEIDYPEFRAFVASGASDEEIATWMRNTPKSDRAPRSSPGTTSCDQRLSDLSPEGRSTWKTTSRNSSAEPRRLRMVRVYDIERSGSESRQHLSGSRQERLHATNSGSNSHGQSGSHHGVFIWIPAFWVPALLVTHYVTFIVLARYKIGAVRLAVIGNRHTPTIGRATRHNHGLTLRAW